MKRRAVLGIFAGAVLTARASWAAGTDAIEGSVIRIGNSLPYSGPASAYGVIGKGMSARFDEANREGGVGGYKLEFKSVDDGYSPSRTLQQTRALVERDKVHMIFGTLGTSHNAVIQEYLNRKEIPQLFISSGGSRWGDPENYPWTMGWQPTYSSEGFVYARHAMETINEAKIAVLYQNDDAGADTWAGIQEALEDNENALAKALTFEPTDASVDSQIVELANSGANVLLLGAIPKIASQAIRKAGEIGWEVTIYVTAPAASIEGVMKPAGIGNSQGVRSGKFLWDPADPEFIKTAGYEKYIEALKKYDKKINPNDYFVLYGYAIAETLVKTLDAIPSKVWTASEVMKSAKNLDIEVTGLLPGVRITTSDNDPFPITDLNMFEVKGEEWVAI